MLKIKEIEPLFNQILVTENLYGWDDKDESGIIVATKGDIKPYQTVVAVGKDVKYVKPGDVVAINFYKYVEFKHDQNSVKAIDGNSAVKIHLNEVSVLNEEGEEEKCFFIDERDVKYIMKDYDEIVYSDDDEVVGIAKPKVNLILPNKKLRV